MQRANSLFLSLCGAVLILLVSSCQQAKPEEKKRDYSNHFKLEKREGFQILNIHRPFVNGSFSERYVLYPRGSKKPELDSITHFIETPVQSLAITSTTHVGYLAALNSIDKIIAANNLDLVFDSLFQKRVEAGQIQSLGIRQINQEKLIEQNPDLVLGYAIDMSSFRQIEHWRDLGLPVILLSEFMEQDPLDKARWLEVLGAMLGKEKEAKSWMDKISFRYDSLKRIAQNFENKPSLIMGFPWKGTWYMSGGSSFQAKLFEDAGANYLWSDVKQESGMPLSIEQVFAKGLEADYWLNTNAMKSREEMLAADARFAEFKAFQEGNIYNNNKRLNAQEGNDYWESAVYRPDLVLFDIIQILHPEAYPNPELYYYQKVN